MNDESSNKETKFGKANIEYRRDIRHFSFSIQYSLFVIRYLMRTACFASTTLNPKPQTTYHLRANRLLSRHQRHHPADKLW